MLPRSETIGRQILLQTQAEVGIVQAASVKKQVQDSRGGQEISRRRYICRWLLPGVSRGSFNLGRSRRRGSIRIVQIPEDDISGRPSSPKESFLDTVHEEFHRR